MGFSSTLYKVSIMARILYSHLSGFKRIALFISMVFSLNLAYSQVEIDMTMTPEQLVQDVLLGNGVAVFNITFNGQPADQITNQMARFFGTSAFVGFDEAILLGSGDVSNAGPDPQFQAPTNPVQNDPDLVALSGFNINDAAVLEFDFIPNGDSLEFRYVFGSTEYPSFTCSSFNDAFGFFVSGPGLSGPYSNNSVNIAVIPGSNIPVAVNTINSGTPSANYPASNCASANPNWIADSQYFVNNNPQTPGDVQIPGLTVPLTAYALVQCGAMYHIKIAIGDASDGALDSFVFLEAESFSSNSVVQVNLDVPIGINDSTLYEGCGQAVIQFIRPPASIGLGIDEVAYLEFSGTAINGVDIVPALPDSVVFLAGNDTVTFIVTAPNGASDGIIKIFTVTITNIASNCTGAELTSEFSFYVSFAEPLVVTGFNTSLVDCNDEVDIFPTVTGGYGEYRYFWSTGDEVPLITVSPGFTTTYFLTVSDTCTAGSQQVSFQVDVPTYPPVVVDLGEDFVINECDVTINIIPTVTGGFGSYSYNWTSGGESLGILPALAYFVESSTNITLTVTDDCDAIGIDEVGVIVPPVEVSVFLPDIFEVNSCLEGFLMPAIAEGGIGTKTYTWLVDGAEQAITQDVYFQYHASMGQTVVLYAEDECDNFSSDTTVVSLNFPAIDLKVSADTSICEQTGAELRVSASAGSGNFSIYWEDLGLSDSIVYVTPDALTRYIVTVTDTCGVEAQEAVSVSIRQVRADFEYEYVDYYGVQILNRSTPYNSTYVWEFGDGASSTEENPRHIFLDNEEYQIDLLVTDEMGCQDSTYRIVLPPVELFIPNSFTPNGDGINDLFDVVGSNVSKFEMWIYDRWGREVFYTSDITKKWNGSYDGGDYYANSSMYAFMIKYKGMKEEDALEKTGTITVVR